MAGVISAVVQIAYCISFAALIFTGDLAGGFRSGLAGLIMGTVVTCVVIAVTSTFSPVIGGPDSPAVAVMSVLAASIATALAAKGAEHRSDHRQRARRALGQHAADRHPALRRRRAPPGPVAPLHSVPGGRRLPCRVRHPAHHRRHGGGDADRSIAFAVELGSCSTRQLYGPQILVAMLFAVAIPMLGAMGARPILRSRSAFFAFLVVLNGSLFGIVSDEACAAPGSCRSSASSRCGGRSAAMFGDQVDWGVIAQSSAEIGSFCGVMAIALLLDVSSLEVARQKSGDLDQEFRSNGLANLLASVLGGFGGSLSMNACLLLDEFGRHHAVGRRHCRIGLRADPVFRRRCRRLRAEGHSRRDAHLSRRGHPYRVVERAGRQFLDGMGA